jgi:predicted metalloprotease with PDZ domain
MRIFFCAFLLFPALSSFAEADFGKTVTVQVDASQISRKIVHAHLVMPVKPGPLTLFYPKWIPGEHAPTGPIQGLVDLQLSANGKRVPWRRDLVELYTIQCEVPAGTANLEIDLDYLIPVDVEGYSSAAAASAMLGMLNWNQVILYPSGSDTDHLTYQATLKLPQGWRLGTALPVASKGDTVQFKPVSLTTLVDSPVVMGLHYRNIPLTEGSGTPSSEMDIVADSSVALELPDAKIAQFRQLITQAKQLFGATHYEHYHFLCTLSDSTFHDGIEHHESSLDTMPENWFTDKDALATAQDLLPHEFVHSWNGKYRRPADLATPDYQQPMKDDLLWVYEGLTEYLGSFVLTARSGLRDMEMSREFLAGIAAQLDQESGRTWRPLQDTADYASFLYASPKQWRDRRRWVDFYAEGVLLWLEADTVIRQKTSGGKSLDDFCHDFHGGESGAPILKTYVAGDVMNALNNVAPVDWASFWAERLNVVSPRAPMKGIESTGWRVVYNDQPNRVQETIAKPDKVTDAWFSLGLLIGEESTIVDVRGNSAADAAKLAPGMKIIAVNSRSYSADRLKEAITEAAQGSKPPVELLVNNADYFQTFKLDYHDGPRYPHLERDSSRPDLLSEILKPRTN